MRKLGAVPVFLIWTAVSSFYSTIIFTVLTVYFVQKAGLNPLQLVLVGTVCEGVIFLCEIPTGVVADTYSRRLSVIIGTVLFGVAYLIQGSVSLFWAILASEAVRGVAETFMSGALDAWIADEVGAEHVWPVYLRGAQAARVAGLLGVVASVPLAWVNLSLPILLAGSMAVLLGLFLVLFMPETGFQPTPRAERNTWQSMGATFGEGVALVRRRPVLTTFLLIAVCWGMSTEGLDRLWEAHFIQSFSLPALGGLTPVAWVAAIGVGWRLIGLATGEITRRRIDITDQRVVARVITVATGLQAVSVMAFGLAGSFWGALAAYAGVAAFRTTVEPIRQTWLVQHIEPRVRATVLSMNSQADAIGQVAGGPVVGAVGAARSLGAALVLAGAVLVPSLPLFVRAGRQGKDAAEAVVS